MGERSSFWKRPREDNESAGPSDISKRKQEEDATSTVFASGPSGRRSTLFRPIVQSQEQQKQHERTSLVPASQQVGGEDLLGHRNQLQETHHRSQAVLGGLDQHMAKIQQQAGPRKPGREVRLFGVNIASDQRMDEKSKEIGVCSQLEQKVGRGI